MKSLGWALIQQDCVLMKRRNLDTEVEIQGDCHVVIGVMWPQDKEHQRWPAEHQDLGEGCGPDPPAQPSEGNSPDSTLNLGFWPPELFGTLC